MITRHDLDPFGLEIPAGVAGRTSKWGAADSVRQQFTGQERDTESGFDYFNARYFASSLGRFHSPDLGNAGANLADPQSWNGYSYVRGTPTSLTDPSGLNPCQGNFACLSQIGICQTDPTVCQQAGFFNSDALQGALNSFDPFNLLNNGQIGSEGTRQDTTSNFLNGSLLSSARLPNLIFDQQDGGTALPSKQTMVFNIGANAATLVKKAGLAICGSQRSVGEQVSGSVRNGAIKGAVGGGLNGAGFASIPFLIPNIVGGLELGAEIGVVGGPTGIFIGVVAGSAVGAINGVVLGFGKAVACPALGF